MVEAPAGAFAIFAGPFPLQVRPAGGILLQSRSLSSRSTTPPVAGTVLPPLSLVVLFRCTFCGLQAALLEAILSGGRGRMGPGIRTASVPVTSSMNTRSQLIPQVLRAAFGALLAVVCLAITPSPAPAGEDPFPWRAQIGLSTLYDDNILRYSDKYLGRFAWGEDEGRFHIETTDDLVFHTFLRLERSLAPLGDYPLTLATRVDFWNFSRNTIKNWWAFSLSARQELPEQFSMLAQYNYLPEFYVRHYSDDDWVRMIGLVPERFQRFSYARDEVRLTARRTLFQSTGAAISYSLVRYYNNQHFTEYDSRNIVWEFGLSHPLLSTLRVNAGYMFTTSDAVAVDEPGETPATADDADGSYDEDAYSAGFTWRLPRLLGLTTRISMAGEYSRRFYTTLHFAQVDPQHAGREDLEYMATIEWNIRFDDHWELVVGYTWWQRDSRTAATENEPLLSDEKDYRKHQLELGVTYDLDF